ncbi:MAG TPA: SPFH domain-containing protein [Candidatus Paceibacterota bacterium]|nr:SPFH domain-containing protein [Candidatus Paceibacterota bacterium]
MTITTPPTTPADEDAPLRNPIIIDLQEWHWTTGWWIWWVSMGALFLLGLGLSPFSIDFGTPGAPNEWNLGFPFLIFPLASLAFSIFGVDTTEVATITAFGKPVTVLQPGLRLAAWPYLRRRRWPTTSIQLEFPGETDLVFFGDEKEPLPPGMVRADRSMPRAFDKPVPEHPTDAAMPIAHSRVIRYRITKPFHFQQAFQNLAEAERQLRDFSRTEIDDEISKRTTREVLEGREKIHKALEKALQNLLGDTATLEIARMFSPSLGHATSDTLAGIVRARAQAISDEVKGKGEGLKAKGILSGRAEGIKALKEAGVDPVISESADAMRETFKNADKIITPVDSVAGMAVNIATALKAAASSHKGSTP